MHLQDRSKVIARALLNFDVLCLSFVKKSSKST